MGGLPFSERKQRRSGRGRGLAGKGKLWSGCKREEEIKRKNNYYKKNKQPDKEVLPELTGGWKMPRLRKNLLKPSIFSKTPERGKPRPEEMA